MQVVVVVVVAFVISLEFSLAYCAIWIWNWNLYSHFGAFAKFQWQCTMHIAHSTQYTLLFVNAEYTQCDRKWSNPREMQNFVGCVISRFDNGHRHTVKLLYQAKNPLLCNSIQWPDCKSQRAPAKCAAICNSLRLMMGDYCGVNTHTNTMWMRICVHKLNWISCWRSFNSWPKKQVTLVQLDPNKSGHTLKNTNWATSSRKQTNKQTTITRNVNKFARGTNNVCCCCCCLQLTI